MEQFIETEYEMLRHGLELVGFEQKRRTKVKHLTNIYRFKSHFGSTPFVCAQIWEDLLFTNIPDAFIGNDKPCVDSFLLALHFLQCYPTEVERSATIKICEKLGREWRGTT